MDLGVAVCSCRFAAFHSGVSLMSEVSDLDLLDL